MTGRAAYRELKTLFEPIDSVERLWIPQPASWTDHEIQMVISQRDLILQACCMETTHSLGEIQSDATRRQGPS